MMVINTQGIFEYLSNTTTRKKITDFAIMTTFGVIVYTTVLAIPTYITHDTEQVVDNVLPKYNAIHDKLYSIRQRTNSDIVMLFRYHNGTHGINGFSFLKMSATNADYKQVLSINLTDWQNIPISVQLTQLEQHIKGECFSYKNDVSQQLYPLYLKYSFGNITTCPVIDYNKSLIGYIMITDITGKDTTQNNIIVDSTTKTIISEIGLI